MKEHSFRPDIEGLRGLAILLVVAYHAHVPGFSGGYIGVDVFFVISGYLITRLLVAEIETSGRVDLARFYARRVRRLLPAAALVLLVTLFVGRLIAPPVEHRELANTALATALYVSNLWFARNATDYLAADADANPLLHTWSLSVEEQFYVVWPMIVLVALRGSRGRLSRRRLAIVMAAVAIASLGVAILLSRIAQPWAFFGSPGRAWEFALGALAGLARTSGLAARPALERWLAGAGILAILLAGALLDRNSSFPGFALAPVVATAALLLTGAGGSGGWVTNVLVSAPMQWLGRVSYVWYLWHWPVRVFAESLFGPLRPAALLALSALALGLAALTQVALENPIRFNRALGQRTLASLAMGLFITLLGAGTSWWVRHSGMLLASEPSQLRFQQAREEIPRIYKDGCHLDLLDTHVADCAYGDTRSPVTVVLIGDSHAAQWFPALDRAGNVWGWKIVSWTKSSCPAASVDIYYARLGRIYDECHEWRSAVVERLIAMRPAAVVISSWGGYVGAQGEATEWQVNADQWTAGIDDFVRRITDAGARALLVMDSPAPGFDVPTCLSKAAWNPWLYQRSCDFARARGTHAVTRRIDFETAARVAKVSTIDPAKFVCDQERCATERDGIVLYRDAHHLSLRFAVSLGGMVAVSIRDLIDARN